MFEKLLTLAFSFSLSQKHSCLHMSLQYSMQNLKTLWLSFVAVFGLLSAG